MSIVKGIRASSLALTMLAGSVAFAGAGRGADRMESEQVTKILSDAKVQAIQLQEDAGQLESFTRSQVSWEGHTEAVARIKEDVNSMGRLLVKLEDNRSGAAPWQQAAIDRLTPVAKELASNTTSAIEHLNHSPSRLNSRDYQEYLEAICDSANNLAATISNFVEYGKTKQRLERMSSKLELPAAR